MTDNGQTLVDYELIKASQNKDYNVSFKMPNSALEISAKSALRFIVNGEFVGWFDGTNELIYESSNNNLEFCKKDGIPMSTQPTQDARGYVFSKERLNSLSSASAENGTIIVTAKEKVGP